MAPTYASSQLAAPNGEGGWRREWTLIRQFRRPKKPNKTRLRQRAAFCFAATTVYHPVCAGNHQICVDPWRKCRPLTPRSTVALRHKWSFLSASCARSGRDGGTTRPIVRTVLLLMTLEFCGTRPCRHLPAKGGANITSEPSGTIAGARTRAWRYHRDAHVRRTDNRFACLRLVDRGAFAIRQRCRAFPNNAVMAVTMRIAFGAR
jgi:hypothetical protein